tara:strand:+ start:473 stop:703 length:231 start_codon:yes stop_codon:yes gene_type:complete
MKKINWKEEVLKNHKGQTGFFKEIYYKGGLKAIDKINLINEITNYIKETHNEKDIKDLKTFTLKELKEILKDCKEL